ncbi:hypothetical protein [Staphylospora marina]|uniref:hypothetical protein n=1 Tax=Staphylospora marina TaxID=2490858 RepID=UPI000F5BC26A|nr:hypothetical protein [Staphylospora marina]
MTSRRRCLMVMACAPEGMKLREANHLFNRYIADRERGHCVFHDHFLDRPGGVAFFEATDKEQEERIRQASELPGWTIQVHPLIHSRSAAGFVAQLDYTSGTYFNIPLSALTERIRKAKEENRSPYQA